MDLSPEMLEEMAKTAEALRGFNFVKTAQVQFGLTDLSDASIFEKIGTDFFLAEQEWGDIANGLVAADNLTRK